MAVEERVRPYEILVRFDEDGDFQGAHFKRRRRVLESGVVKLDELLAPEPIPVAEFAGSGVMLEATATALAAAEKALVETAAAKAEAEAAQMREQEATVRMASAEMAAQIAAAAADEAHEALAGRDRSIAELQIEIDRLSAEAVALRAQIPVAATEAVLSALDMRRALRAKGLKEAAEAWVAERDDEVREWWQYATEFRRDEALVAAMGTAVGLDATGLDGLFAYAG